MLINVMVKKIYSYFVITAMHESISLLVKVRTQHSKPSEVGLGTDLFVMVPRPGDSEVTFSVFKSSCRLLLPV